MARQRSERRTQIVCVTSKTISTKWTTRGTWPTAGRSAAVRWRARAKRWSAIDSKGAACGGAKPALTPSATSAPSTSANPAAGSDLRRLGYQRESGGGGTVSESPALGIYGDLDLPSIGRPGRIEVGNGISTEKQLVFPGAGNPPTFSIATRVF